MSAAVNRRSVLLTGAAGRIGTAFRLAHGTDYRLRLADLDLELDALASTPGEEHEVIRLDVSDAAACEAACAGIDTVIHLAADPRPDAPWASLLQNNIQGVVNICEAALAAGCRRLIFASSAHAIGAYPPERMLADDAPPRPGNLYGASKVFGEATLSALAARGLSGIAIRIGAYDAPWYFEDTDDNVAAAYISPRDMNQLLVRSIETPDITYAVVAGISDNRRKRFDLRLTRALLGYVPRDDGFRAREEHATGHRGD
ncbi:MAG: NAD(P)-dependent oxidoreductase [Thermomicrobiales bacterium]